MATGNSGVTGDPGVFLACYQIALATVRPLGAGLCVLSGSVLPEAREHYTLQELRVKQTWWFSSFGTSESPKVKSYPQKLVNGSVTKHLQCKTSDLGLIQRIQSTSERKKPCLVAHRGGEDRRVLGACWQTSLVYL